MNDSVCHHHSTSGRHDFCAFWRGLEKDCVQSGSGKEPVPYDLLVDYLMRLNETTDSPIVVRNAAMVVVGFFGVRRGAEVAQFLVTDVLESSDSVVQLRARCQKNDQVGLGHICIIPAINAMGACSPPRPPQVVVDSIRAAACFEFPVRHHNGQEQRRSSFH